MRKIEYTCDKCFKPITGNGNLCVLSYQGLMGHNRIPDDGWHFHYECLSFVVDGILKAIGVRQVDNMESKETGNI